MNIVKILSVIGSILLFFSCSKDCNCTNGQLQYPELYQTYWEGVLVHKLLGEKHEYQIKISFDYKSRGDYVIMNSTVVEPYSPEGFFQYEQEHKIIYIKEGSIGNILNGNWLITDYKENYIMLQNNIIDEMNSSNLILKKIY